VTPYFISSVAPITNSQFLVVFNPVPLVFLLHLNCIHLSDSVLPSVPTQLMHVTCRVNTRPLSYLVQEREPELSDLEANRQHKNHKIMAGSLNYATEGKVIA
jgi:hypothetical protein